MNVSRIELNELKYPTAYRPRFEADISIMQLRNVIVRANLLELIENTWLINLWEIFLTYAELATKTDAFPRATYRRVVWDVERSDLWKYNTFVLAAVRIHTAGFIAYDAV
jgi:hypothetical protein